MTTMSTRPTSSLTFPNVSFLGPSADDLLNITDVENLSKADRWHLIDLIDQRIDRFQGWQQQARTGTQEYNVIVTKLKALRLKRYQVWSTFHPKYQSAVRLAA